MNCLSYVQDLVDEIIVVDTGSEDATKEIAAKMTDLICDFKWVNDFSAARNFTFSHATKDFILWLDADDVLLEKDRAVFKSAKRRQYGRITGALHHRRFGARREGRNGAFVRLDIQGMHQLF